MALYQINMTIRDEDNDSATVQFSVNAADEAAAVTRANAIAGLLDDLTGGVITNLAVSRNLDRAGLKITPVAGIDIERGLRLIFGTSFTGVNPIVTVPGIRHMNEAGTTELVKAGGKLNDEAAEWDALFEEIFVTGDYEDYRGADLLVLRDNYEVHNGKKRG